MLSMVAPVRQSDAGRRCNGATCMHDVHCMAGCVGSDSVLLRICPTRHRMTPWCSHAPALLVQVGKVALWCWLRSVSACCVYLHAYGAPLGRGMWSRGARHG